MSYYVFSIGWYLSNDFYSLIFFNFPVFILLLSLQPIFKSWQKKKPACLCHRKGTCKNTYHVRIKNQACQQYNNFAQSRVAVNELSLHEPPGLWSTGIHPEIWRTWSIAARMCSLQKGNGIIIDSHFKNTTRTLKIKALIPETYWPKLVVFQTFPPIHEKWRNIKNNTLTLSTSNGINSELGCSSTSDLTKKKIRPLEQMQKSCLSFKV